MILVRVKNASFCLINGVYSSVIGVVGCTSSLTSSVIALNPEQGEPL